MSDSKMTTLYLVRHGATDANLRRPYVLQGRGMDLPLNEVGRRQADRVWRLFQAAPVAAVYASPMRRAVETAQTVADFHRLPVNAIDELIECDVGRWEGMDWESIRRQFPREYDDFQRDPKFPYLGGESYHDVLQRALPAIETLIEKHAGQTVVAVAHNVVNRACIAALLRLDLALAKDIHQANGGVNVIRRTNGRIDLVTLNSVFHLEDDLRLVTIRGVIFDLDGTLIDSGLDFPAIRREMGLPEGVPILEALAEIPAGDRLETCLRVLDRHEQEGAERATLMPGVRELLTALAARNIAQGVLTRNSRKCTARVLSRLGLSFTCVITREDGPPKPDPAGLLNICSIWKAPVAEVIFVGDYLHDINCGRNAGMRTILFAPTKVPHYSPLADFCVSSFFDVSRLIDQLLAGQPTVAVAGRTQEAG